MGGWRKERSVSEFSTFRALRHERLGRKYRGNDRMADDDGQYSVWATKGK